MLYCVCAPCLCSHVLAGWQGRRAGHHRQHGERRGLLEPHATLHSSNQAGQRCHTRGSYRQLLTTHPVFAARLHRCCQGPEGQDGPDGPTGEAGVDGTVSWPWQPRSQGLVARSVCIRRHTLQPPTPTHTLTPPTHLQATNTLTQLLSHTIRTHKTNRALV